MELRFRDAAIADLRSFILHYENAFFELYQDSGIWAEDAIIENLRQSAGNLFTGILGDIERHLAPSRVLGRKKPPKSWYEFVFHIGTRLVIVYYSEEGKSTRWVEAIAIDRKPIIF